ncbi:MAG: hypothetical protein HFE66_08405 [Clostridiales bacterium]|jgi:hypothetical protein|nr:hypothetical protein [Clostridiales bacterium]
MGAKIIYKNYALIDKKSTIISSNSISPFARLKDLQDDSMPRRLASFEEQYMCSDVGYPFYCLGDDITESVGYISEVMCDRTGEFGWRDDYPVLTVRMYDMEEGRTKFPITSDGITLYFSPIEEEYATEVELIWHLAVAPGGKEKTVTDTFYPDSNVFFCKKKVEGYIQLDIIFKKWSFGHRWARLYRIDYGHEEVYEGDVVLSASVTENVNLVADQLQVNTSSVVLWADPEATFQEQQDFEIWYGGERIAKHYVTDLKMQGQRVSITGNDILSKLDKSKIKSISSTGMTLADWVEKILSDGEDTGPSAVVLDLESDASILDKQISGSIDKEMTKREALTVLCLSAGAYVDTSRSDGILIKSTRDALEAPPVVPTAQRISRPKIIPEVQVFSGDSTEMREPYRTLAIKYKESDKKEYVITEPLKNTAYSGSAAELVLDASAMCVTKVDADSAYKHFNTLRDLYAKYYFHSEFYKAKSVMDSDIHPGDRILINGKDVFLVQRTLHLEGDKLVADGTYKLVEGR